MMDVLILADDLTGALDTASQFGRGSFVALNLEIAGYGWKCVSLSTDTRLVPPTEAERRVREVLEAALELASPRYLYKKVDSTMRGNVGAELNPFISMLETSLPFTPAYPEQGRTVLNGRLYVGGIPLEKTEYVRELPVASSLIEEIVRATSPDLTIGYWGEGDSGVLIAKEVPDRRALSLFFREISGYRVMGGSAGLALELARGVGVERGEAPKASGPILFVSGSENEVTARQLEALSEEIPVLEADDFGIEEVARTLRDGGDAAIRLRLAGMKPGRLERIRGLLHEAGGLVVIGGETLRKLMEGMGVMGVEIGEPPEQGLAAGWIVGGSLDGLPIVTKAGGFGTETTLVRVGRWLREADLDNDG